MHLDSRINNNRADFILRQFSLPPFFFGSPGETLSGLLAAYDDAANIVPNLPKPAWAPSGWRKVIYPLSGDGGWKLIEQMIMAVNCEHTLLATIG